MIQRIMVPTDGSPASELAIPIAQRLAAAQSAETLLVQVIPYPVVYNHFSMDPEIYQLILDASQSEAASNLGRLKSEFEDRGIRTRTLSPLGSPAATLLDAERDEKVDLVVMGTHGRTGLARFALGGSVRSQDAWRIQDTLNRAAPGLLQPASSAIKACHRCKKTRRLSANVTPRPGLTRRYCRSSSKAPQNLSADSRRPKPSIG